MTKLFSMKSVAFAGAAAFALALAVAPQADAAEAGKPGIAFEQVKEYSDLITAYDLMELPEKEQAEYSRLGYEDEDEYTIDNANYASLLNLYGKLTGKLTDNVTINEAVVLVSKSAVNIAGGKLEYYYSSVKKDAEPKKWKSVCTYNYREETDGNYLVYVPVGEIAKEKEVDIYIAADADGIMRTKAIKCKAVPKIKVAVNNLASGPSITLTDKKKNTLETGYLDVYSQYGGTLIGNTVTAGELAKGNAVLSALQEAADMGGVTFYVTYRDADLMTPIADAKLKIPAAPKAPKISLKLAKSFSLKLKDNIKYRTFAKKDGEPSEYDRNDNKQETWTTGTGQALSIDTLFDKKYLSDSPVSGEFILNETMNLQAKTFDKKGKKVDSRISTTTVYKSTVTPGAVNAVVTGTTNTKKSGTTTDAAVEFKTEGLTLSQEAVVSSGAVVTLQYYDTTGKKWKDVKGTSQKVTFKSGKIPDKIYVRVKGVDYKAGNTKKGTKASYFEAPGRVMTITMDKNDPAGSTYSITSSAVSIKLDDVKYDYK